MFRELVALGRDLEKSMELPPSCFYQFGKDKPIRWIIHLRLDNVYVEEANLFAARPFSGRTRRIEAHLLTDEAGYALGVSRKSKGGTDPYVAKKHPEFVKLTEAFLSSSELQDKDLREAIEWLLLALNQDWLSSNQRFHEIASEHWVSFVPGHGRLQGKHLFEHPEAKAFWSKEMKRRCLPQDKRKNPILIIGTCASCANPASFLIRKMPLKVRLHTVAPLHSLDDTAYTSFIGGAGTSDTAHLGICFECSDLAARAFNHLSNSARHRRDLLRDPEPKNKDKLTNQIALFWLKAPGPIRVEEVVINFNDLATLDLGAVAAPSAPSADLSQLHALLKLPWQPVDAAFRLDDYGFYLGVLSPNVGRIALREWIATSLTEVRSNLASFLDATAIVTERGDVRPVSVRTMVEAIGNKSPNLTRNLLRLAYAGVRPPKSLAVQAGQRLNHLLPNETSLRERQNRGNTRTTVWDERWLHALAATIKLALFYGSEEVQSMGELNPLFQSRAYHCGRLLAVLEEAQQRYHYRRHGERLDTTLVNRSYGGAASAPKTTFAPLFRLTSTSHLPESPRWLNEEVEAITSTLVALGGMPATLSLPDQAEFGLGFYHQRAELRARRVAKTSEGQQPGETVQG